MLPPRIFCCVAFVHLHKNQRTKLDPCAVRCLFLGYGSHKKGFRCYDPTTNRTYITIDVTFLESENFYSSLVPNSSLQGETHGEEPNWLMAPTGEYRTENRGVELHDASPLENEHAEHAERAERAELNEKPGHEEAENEHDAELRNEEPENEGNEKAENGELIDTESSQSPHSSVPEDFTPPENVPKGLSKPLKTFTQTLSSCHIPSSVEEALSNPKWAQAMQEELEALKKNNTWKLVPLPEGKKIVGCKWVFSIKYKADGLIDRYKARLVAKGFTQMYGIDY
ncbi:uncharacterized protein LOC109013191 isoform X3 [Juglans regia]|uniref:Uncharacterized protein LOC109013191 isoform X3 n=1 Tax=Juglans regia TaxID=51240 RepID=A0A6P9E2G9_JUGRE|nr:uncharacterized protein LOC109013191 isoform X3 [Juglans regia]